MSTVCKACGAELTQPTSHFCSECGARLDDPESSVRSAGAAFRADGPGSLAGAALRAHSPTRVGSVVLDRYRLVRLVGEGGVGRVYEAEQAIGRGSRRVAVKVLLPEHLVRASIGARFLREIELASQLSHPNTIRIFDFGQTSDRLPFAVMEFIDGVPLSQELQTGGPLPLARAELILGQVCASLAEAHGLGIIHRDLKPDNIMLTKLGGQGDFVKVLDFGIAKRFSVTEGHGATPVTEEGYIVGTPEYMSPEQFGGDNIGPASDIYSLGVIAYEMLTGRLPFDAESVIEWGLRHNTEPPLPFEATAAGALLPDKTKQAVLRALEKYPDQRPASVSEFFEDLDTGASRLSFLGAPPPSIAPRPKPAPKAQATVPLEQPPAFESAPPAAGDVGTPRPRALRFALLVTAALVLAAGVLILWRLEPWKSRTVPALPLPTQSEPAASVVPLEVKPRRDKLPVRPGGTVGCRRVMEAKTCSDARREMRSCPSADVNHATAHVRLEELCHGR